MRRKRDEFHELDLLVLAWHGKAPELDPQVFRRWALMELKDVIAFDAVVWEGRAGHGSDDLSLDPHQEGDAHGATGDGTPTQATHTVAVAGGSDRATSRQSIRFLRRPDTAPFDGTERAALTRLALHLALAYASCRRWWMTRAQLGARPRGEIAVAADRNGALHERPERRLVALLQREWSSWRGERLPVPMLEFIARRGELAGQFLGRRIAVELIPSGASLLLVIRPRHAADVLTEREGEIAHHYAGGSSFRQIAEALGLAPATVRAHLRNVFAKLQVRSKTQLGEALR